MIGAELRQHREACGVSQVDLSRELRVSQSAVAHMEARSGVRATTAQRYFAALATCVEARAERQRAAGEALLEHGLALVVASA